MQERIDRASSDQPEPLPFPFNQRTFCRYEPIEKRIAKVRVLVVDNLLRDESDLSDLAKEEWGRSAARHLSRERSIASVAIENIISNISRLVREPDTRVAHLSELAETVQEFEPEAILLSGTLADFDYYNPALFEKFREFAAVAQTPMLGICGGHQLVGMAFGADIKTLDHRAPHERREDRPCEYQYRFIRITAPDDPIFCGIHDPETGVWQDYTTEGRILRVWQNHGLQLDRIPPGFKLLATSYLCRYQMMVLRERGQLIYSVQFHLEKSFEDWKRSRTRWEHPNESRDGRIIFENFLRLALEHKGAITSACPA